MKKKVLIAVLVAFSLLVLTHHLIGVARSTTPLSATFIDVGQGDSCWLHLPNGDDVLVDGGKPQAGPTVVAYLDDQGVTDIELMVATHDDADYIGGLIDVLASMPVIEAWLDSQTCTTGTCQEFYQALADNGVVTATVRMGESYPWGGVTALVLNPSEPLYADKNENSVVLRVSYGSVDFMLTGDAETGAENRMLNSGHPLEAEILKVAHHGSSSSSSPDFLSAVGPEVAVISVGPNPWGHPTEQTLSRLQAVGATIYRTDQQGTITVTTDGSTYLVSVSEELTKTVFLPIVLNAYSPLTGYTVSGHVAEFPPCFGNMRGVTVILEPTGRTTTTDLSMAQFSFDQVPDGDYTLIISPSCNPYGCWPETPVTVAGEDVFVQICPVAHPTPPTTQRAEAGRWSRRGH